MKGLKQLPRLQSSHVILDVKSGRKSLAKIIKKHVVPVVIRGRIVCVHSHDDGESIEFFVHPLSIKLGKPIKRT